MWVLCLYKLLFGLRFTDRQADFQYVSAFFCQQYYSVILLIFIKFFFRDNSDDDDSISKMTSDNDESLTKFILYQRTSEKRETRPKTLKIYFAFFIHRLNFAINQQRIKNNTTPVLYGNKIIIIIIRI